MIDWLKNIFSGNVWLGMSKDDAVGSGIYRFTFLESSVIAGVISKLISTGKTYNVAGYSLDIREIDAATYAGKVVLTMGITKTEGAAQAGAGWYVILGGIGAAVLLSSIEKIEKLVDTTTTRTIQLGIVILLILIVWKFTKRN